MAKRKSSVPTGLRLKGDIYYLNKMVKGIRLCDRVGPDLDVAIAVLKKRETEIYDGSFFPNKISTSITVIDLLNSYWDEHLKKLKSAKSRKTCLTNLRKKLGHLQWEQLNLAVINNYRDKRLAEFRPIHYIKDGVPDIKNGNHITPRTVNSEIAELQAAIQWAINNRRIAYNPISLATPLAEPKKNKIMLDDGIENGTDWLKLYNEAHESIKPILLCQYESGLRIGEVLAMEWNWIDMIKGFIDVPDYSSTKRGGLVPISPKLLAMLASLPKTSTHVFPNSEGEKRKGIKKAFETAVRKAGLQW